MLRKTFLGLLAVALNLSPVLGCAGPPPEMCQGLEAATIGQDMLCLPKGLGEMWEGDKYEVKKIGPYDYEARPVNRMMGRVVPMGPWEKFTHAPTRGQGCGGELRRS